MNPASAPAQAAGELAALGSRLRAGDRVIIAAAAMLAVALVVVGRTSVPAFVILLAIVAVVTALAARRWPLVTLVTASLATLADPVIVPALLPEGFDPSPIGLSEPMLAAAGAVILATAIRKRAFGAAVRDPVFILAALFVVAAIASALVNGVPPPVAVLVAALVGVAQAVIDPRIFGLVPFIGQFGEGLRIGSFLGNPNMLASVIGLALPFALFASARGDRSRWPARVALYLLMLALLLTYSRGGWLAVGLGATLGAVFLHWRALPVLAVAVALAWGTVAVLPRAGAAPNDPAGGLVGSTFDRFAHLGDGDDLRARFLRDGLPIVADHPLLGVGPGRYGGAVAAIVPSPVYEAYSTGLFGYRTVHDFWLHLVGETGVIGLTIFLGLIAGLVIRFTRAARSASGVAFVVLAGGATMLVVASLNSLTEMIFEGNMPSVLIWLVVGLASRLVPGATVRQVADDAPMTRR